METHERKEESGEPTAQHEDADDHTHDIGEARQHEWNEPHEQHPETRERDVTERFQAETGVFVRFRTLEHVRRRGSKRF